MLSTNDIDELVGGHAKLVDLDGGSREKQIAETLRSLANSEKFKNAYARDIFDGTLAVFNTNSGYVFLVADEGYGALMENDGELDAMLTQPYDGVEGFFDELVDMAAKIGDTHKEDLEFLMDIARMNSDDKRIEIIQSLMGV